MTLRHPQPVKPTVPGKERPSDASRTGGVSLQIMLHSNPLLCKAAFNAQKKKAVAVATAF
ncbi:hypothetical protein [Pantoea sp. 18069]|uniref:hypothetical protein n=1 Tax=Pantoea sp. 18069 TaxID=2681415 RepID=UPI00135BBE6D|nr:hypothetical protein [Pantoea sp. 18069]